MKNMKLERQLSTPNFWKSEIKRWESTLGLNWVEDVCKQSLAPEYFKYSCFAKQ